MMMDILKIGMSLKSNIKKLKNKNVIIYILYDKKKMK
jgi:hypothetical protein